MYKILYIDDTAHWRETYEKAFSEAGAEIKTLPDARGDIINEALEFGSDLILLDICMPEVDGFDALKILKNDARTKNILVFFFSSISNPEYIKKGLGLGAEKYLVKSDYESGKVVEICLKYLKGRHSQR